MTWLLLLRVPFLILLLIATGAVAWAAVTGRD
jgi:hypothetical protein